MKSEEKMQMTFNEICSAEANDTILSPSVSAKPFIKWAGGKGQLLPEIRKAFPKELGRSIKKYAEPFIGGGAVLFEVLNNYKLEEVYISDVNSELIGTYTSIRDDCDAIVDLLNKYEMQYLPLPDDESRQKLFYRFRDRYNELKSNPLDSNTVECSALFIFLNHTCYNGLYRVNANNIFNVPWGKYKRPRICDETNLRAVSRKIKNVEIVCGSYRESDSFIDEDTFVYFDPPYRPLTATASFNTYAKDSFNDDDQRDLADYFKHLSIKGAMVMESNSDPKNINSDDTFFDDLFRDFNITRIKASRMINSKGNGRGKINEILITNYTH